MNKIKKRKNYSKILVFFIICILLITCFFVLFISLKEKNIIDKREHSEKIMNLYLLSERILERIVAFCSNDININPYQNPYENYYLEYGSFPADTLIYMADGSLKRIEDVNINDKIYSYDLKENNFVVSTVISKFSRKTSSLISINDGLFQTTDNHPIVVRKSDDSIVWVSFNPVESNNRDKNRDIFLIEIGDMLFSYELGWVEIKKIEYINDSFEVFSLGIDSNYHNFFADGFLVSNDNINFYVVAGFKEGLDFIYRHGYKSFDISKVENLTKLPIEYLRKEYEIPLEYNFRITISFMENGRTQTYSTEEDLNIYDSDIGAAVSNNIIIEKENDFYYGWIRVEIFIN